MIKKIDPLEIHSTEMSTIRMQHGEQHLTIWFTGPKGGHRAMVRLDRVESEKLLRALARACAALEEAATAAVYADAFRRRAKVPNRKKGRKKINKKPLLTLVTS
jgi:hypothetical protein